PTAGSFRLPLPGQPPQPEFIPLNDAIRLTLRTGSELTLDENQRASPSSIVSSTLSAYITAPRTYLTLGSSHRRGPPYRSNIDAIEPVLIDLPWKKFSEQRTRTAPLGLLLLDPIGLPASHPLGLFPYMTYRESGTSCLKPQTPTRTIDC
ncbi:hypothetical protein PCASD_21152, partial [Puccinia coronata f. sp. avenae]